MTPVVFTLRASLGHHNTLHIFNKKEKSLMENEHVTVEQKNLLNRLVDKDEELRSTKFTKGRFTFRWALIAEQLNALEGPKKTAKEWWQIYQLESKHCTVGNEYVAKINIQQETSTSSNELRTSVSTPSEQKLNSLAAALNDLSTKDISRLKETTMLKLYLLLNADDHTNCLNPTCRMTITDWLLFDTQLVHEDFEVIQKNKTYETDHKPLQDLYYLVEKYDIEYLQGEELANAWTAVTIEYNSGDRQCTPMLLQRRWYQLKLATRKSIYKFRFMYLRSPNDLNLLMKLKLTPLQQKLLCRFGKKVAVEQFLSWEEQIKKGLVILREHFVSIAMKSKYAQTPSIQIITGTPPRINLTSTVEKVCYVTPQKVNPIEYSASHDSISCTTQEHHTSHITETTEECLIKNEPEINIDLTLKKECNSDVSVDNVTLDAIPEYNEMDIDNCPSHGVPVSDELNIEMPGPLSEVTGSFEPVLPQITNVFGNVHVPIEALPKISVLARQITENDVKNEGHITALLNEQSKQNNEGLEIDKTEEIDDGKQLGSMVDEKKKNVTTKDKKLLMNAVVNTVELDHMGVLPMRLLRRVKNKKIIDLINAKSKVPKNGGSKLEGMTNFKSNKVEISNSRSTEFNKYSYSELSKNPDFNISLKKLNNRFFNSDRNRMLLKACKPLSVDIDKSFETKLKNGKMILKPAAYCQNSATYEQVMPHASETNVSLQSSNAKTRPKNITTNPAFVPIAPKVNLSLPRIPDALPIITPKFITVIPLTTKVSTDTESLLVSNSINDSRLIDLYTLNKMLCLLANFDRQQALQNDINASAKQNIVLDKWSNDVQDISEPTVAKSSTMSEIVETDNPEKKKLSRHRFKLCCWARAKMRSIKNGRRILEEHNCDFPSCRCCCKDILAKFYTYQQNRNSLLSNNELSKAVSKVKPKTIYSKAPKEKIKLNKLDKCLNNTASTFTDQPADKYLSLGNNKILLTTAKFPKNFNLFTRFQHYIDNNLTLPKAIRLVLKPNGRVFLKREVGAHIDPKILKEIIYLVSEFNRLSSVTTAPHNLKNNDVTSNTAFNKESSCMEHTEDNSIAEHNNATLKSVDTEKLISNPISGDTVTTILPAQIKQEPDLQPDKENSAVMEKIKSCLGMLVYQSLTPIKLVSEIKYAYLQNGLFFKLDIDTGALMPINVCVENNRTPIHDCNLGSIHSLSVSRKPKTPIPNNSKPPIAINSKPPIAINSKTLSLLTYNDPGSVSSQSPISILSTSPKPTSYSLPGEISCKPIESTLSELSTTANNGHCDVSNIPYLSDLQFIQKSLVKAEDASTITDDDNTESWNLFDNILGIDDGTEGCINRQKESTNTPIGFEVEVDQKEKVDSVEQILGL